jgi:hypothetical protein
MSLHACSCLHGGQVSMFQFSAGGPRDGSEIPPQPHRPQVVFSFRSPPYSACQVPTNMNQSLPPFLSTYDSAIAQNSSQACYDNARFKRDNGLGDTHILWWQPQSGEMTTLLLFIPGTEEPHLHTPVRQC